MRVAYLVHDLSDAAVRRRVRMLRCAGVDVALAGFRRSPAPPEPLCGLTVVDLGRTHNGRMLHRMAAVARQAARTPAWSAALQDADVLLARNLEMLALATAARRRPGQRLVYECLDIHRLMSGRGAVSAALRRLERGLMARADALIVSSPGFLDGHFAPAHGKALPPVALVENKVFPPPTHGPGPARPGPPWVVGWYGAIRCQRSLDILCRVSGERTDLKVIIAGAPALDAFRDFHGQIAAAPNVEFRGRYAHQDLPCLYGAAHFAWAIDYYEAGANSEWLLPNRLYESRTGGAVPIARSGSQSARWLDEHGFGVVLTDPETDLPALLDGMSDRAYAALRTAVIASPEEDCIAGPADCARLRALLQGAPA